VRQLIIAEHSGFCFGVKRAIEKTENAIKSLKEGEKLYVCGHLIHNQSVIDELSEKGLMTVSSPEEIPKGATILIRSHGEPESFYEVAKQKKFSIIDATCPFVQKIHHIVKRAGEDEPRIVVIGDRYHPEVIGINGWCHNAALIINSAEEAREILGQKLLVVAQTTIQQEFFEEMVDILRTQNIVTIENTICGATKERQESCMFTAKKCDIMLVIGGKESSNTRKLYNISRKYCANTFFVENIKELPLKEVEKCNKIGLAAGASTPERVIKEVIAGMSELITNEKNETNLMQDLMDEIEKSLRLPRGGEIVTGCVLQVTDKEIIVNLGCKKDGIIPKDEFTLEGEQKLTDLFKEGDEIQAKVIKTDDGDGNILLSKKKLDVNEHWDEINNALENKSIIEVKVIKQVKGGVIASYKEVSGFIPLSQLSDKFVENADTDDYIGKTLPVRVTRVDQKKGKAAFSHRNYLMEERQKKIDDVWNSLRVDDIVEGTVMRFTDYGAFIDVGGLDGLLHISEISWGKLKHPQEVLTIGQTVNVKVLSMNPEKGKISLGLKQTSPEPWLVIDDRYQVGQVITGKVVQMKEYGAFVELEPGLDGLVHISEVAYKRVTNIANELSIGQIVSAKILEINKEKKRISLSIKETLDQSSFDEFGEFDESETEDVAPEEVVPAIAISEEIISEEAAVYEEAPEESIQSEETDTSLEIEEETTEEVSDTQETETEEIE